MMLQSGAPRILCIGMPVRDLTFRTPAVPARGAYAGMVRACQWQEGRGAGRRGSWWISPVMTC